MVTKHIDVVALLVIALALLAFAKAPEFRFVPVVSAAGYRFQNTAVRTEVCPLSKVISLIH